MSATLNKLPPAHGGELKPLLLQGEELAEERERALRLPKVLLNTKESSDVVMLAMGAFSPLDGFMRRQDYQSTVERMELSNGVLWPIPITVAVAKEQGEGIEEGRDVALVDENSGEAIGTMTVDEKYSYDRATEAREVLGTEDPSHPGVQRICTQGDLYLGGPVRALSEGRYPQEFAEFARPVDTRRIFGERGWSTVAAFQTRNPIHRSHEYLIRIAMEVSDGVFVHPIVGALKPGDVPADVRIRCCRALIDRYLPAERVLLSVYPMEMRYGGPREAVLHAIIRQNFGCSHLIVGRDHAGVGSYYGPFEAQKIFDRLVPGSLAIRPLKLDLAFWCYRCGGMASLKSCPHEENDRLRISGTELRAILSQGRRPPEEFSRPEVTDILIEYYRDHQECQS